MTRRDRIIQAIKHKETDFVPYSIGFTQQALDRLMGYVGDPDYVDHIGNHIADWIYGDWAEVKPGYWCDYYGVVWNRTGADRDIGVIDGFVLPEPTLEGFRFPELDEVRLRREIEGTLPEAGGLFNMFNIGFSTFERAWTLRGMENLLTDMVAEPEFAQELFDAICENNLRILDIALDYPFDGVMFGDDWGQQHGTIMGPNHWREFVKPRIARVYDRVKSTGRYVAQHSCGDIHELFPDLIEIGLDVYQTFQPEIYDVRAIKRDFGRDLTFWGGISTQCLLPFATPEEVKRVTREMLKVVGAGGGYICAPTHAIPGDVPPENIVAMVEALQNQ